MIIAFEFPRPLKSARGHGSWIDSMGDLDPMAVDPQSSPQKIGQKCSREVQSVPESWPLN